MVCCSYDKISRFGIIPACVRYFCDGRYVTSQLNPPAAFDICVLVKGSFTSSGGDNCVEDPSPRSFLKFTKKNLRLAVLSEIELASI